MSYRDDRDALRARIASLEAQLEDANVQEVVEEDVTQRASIATSMFDQKITRYSQSFDGRVSKEGLKRIQQMVWAKLGAADEGPGVGVETPPGTVYMHTRGQRVVRIVETANSTLVSLDHHHVGVVQAVSSVVAFASALLLGLVVGGVHDDWIQMTMAFAVLGLSLLTPIAAVKSRKNRRESVALVEEVARLCKSDPASPSAAAKEVVTRRVRAVVTPVPESDVIQGREYVNRDSRREDEA